ncbi:MAG TPA: SRPBCC domain-containing protein [Anaerolineales bacterium]
MANRTASSIKEIVITREFDAPREKVWQAWTVPEMVQRWYGPEGFTAPSIRIDLRVGGKYIWSMRGPAGSPMDRLMYVAGVYTEIVPNQKLVVVEYRSDENGERLESMGSNGPQGAFPSQMTYTVQFEELAKGKTRLSITYPEPETEAQYQALLKSGMVDGWNSSFNKLSQALTGAAG